MSSRNYLCSLSAVVVSILLLAAVVRTTVGASCEHDGVTYGEGEEITSMHADDPCITCHCFGGKPACLAVMCAALECVNPDFKSNKCCGTCPDGKNCETRDGRLVEVNEKLMEVVQHKEDAICIETCSCLKPWERWAHCHTSCS